MSAGNVLGAKRLQCGAGPQPEAVVAKGDANITKSISWKGSIPWHRREHLVVGETRPGRGEMGVRVTQHQQGLCFCSSCLEKLSSPPPRGGFPEEAEEGNVMIIRAILTASPPPPSSSGETQVHRLCLTSVRFA